MRDLLKAMKQYSSLLRLLGIRASSKILMMRARISGSTASATRIWLDALPFAFWVRPVSSDLGVIRQVFVEREYDLGEWPPYKSHIDKLCESFVNESYVPVIVDAGANIGASSIWFATQFPNCEIYAIEPDKSNFDLLQKNTKHYSNIVTINAGLWDKTANLSITNPNQSAWSRRVEEGADQATVPSVTIQELLTMGKKLRPIVVKIDIEGAETKLLRSQTEWIDDIPLVVFEMHDRMWRWLGMWQGSGHAFFSVLSRRKREYLLRGENVFAFLHPK
jgi:FkbM family methyltransferase